MPCPLEVVLGLDGFFVFSPHLTQIGADVLPDGVLGHPFLLGDLGLGTSFDLCLDDAVTPLS